jgi:hypothetical protein
MGKAFTKGQEVTILASWDNKGTVYYRDAIVHSCGQKQMVLTSAHTGEELGRHFRPVLGDIEQARAFWLGVFPRMTEEQAVASCLRAAGLVLKTERTFLAERKAKYSHNTGYIRCIEKDEAALHEPAALNRNDAKGR